MDFLFCPMLLPMIRFISHLNTCLLALLLIAALSPDFKAQPARVLKAGPPHQTVLPDFQLAHCVLTPGRLRICKAISDTDARLIVERAGKRVASWPAEVFVGDTSDFEVLHADLDGDGRKELIVANHDGTSNGLGVSFWTIYIFPDAEFRRPQAPLIFSVEEYGALGTFVTEGDYVLILTTRWLWSKDPQGRRGEGLYLVGQWWRYRSGELLPVTDRPILARRFLMSFAAERGRTLDDQRAPYQWLKNRRVEALKEDPLTGARRKDVKRGILQNVLAAPFSESETAVEIVFRPERGATSTLKYPANNYQAGEGALEHIGDAASGRIYPDKYFPALREKWLKGKQATLTLYGEDTRSEVRTVLWVAPR